LTLLKQKGEQHQAMTVPHRNREAEVYDSERHRIALIEELKEIFQYRELLNQLVSRNIKVRYKRSILGIAWTMLSPLMMMTVMTLVFQKLFRAELEHYPVYVLSGLIFWTFFSQTTTAAMNELVWGGSLLSRIYVPRSIFAFTALGTGLVNIFLSFVPLLVIMVVTGAPLKPSLLFLPISILIIAPFALGVGLFLSTLAVYFVDVLEMYQIVIMAWFYLSPILYPLDIIPQHYQWLFEMNPVYFFLEVFRGPIYSGKLPDAFIISVSCLISLVTLLLGWWVFTRKADEFAYRV
jgi:ABC-type polysaccharide/polyol phosphate export permease